jgi:hypothetical protein
LPEHTVEVNAFLEGSSEPVVLPWGAHVTLPIHDELDDYCYEIEASRLPLLRPSCAGTKPFPAARALTQRTEGSRIEKTERRPRIADLYT